MINKTLSKIVSSCCLTLVSFAADAEPKPSLELGIGAGALSIPDYRGSAERQLLGFPIPYVIYRGDRFKVGRSGITGELFKDKRWELDLSLNASPPANSDENSRRSGMPDLSPTIELGPKLSYNLGEPVHNVELKLELPVRAVISVDPSDFQQIGWLAQPGISLYAPGYFHGWSLGLKAGLLFADQDYHNYYYGVTEQFATPERPGFQADSGYSGAMLLASLRKRYKQYWVGTFMRYDNLNNVVFEDSPLLEEKDSLMVGVGFAWIFYQSYTPY